MSSKFLRQPKKNKKEFFRIMCVFLFLKSLFLCVNIAWKMRRKKANKNKITCMRRRHTFWTYQMFFILVLTHTINSSNSFFFIKNNFWSLCTRKCSTYKNTPPTSSTRISIESFTECLHQIFTVHRTHRWDGCCRILWLRYSRGRRSTCCWSINFGHVKGHSHFWLITSFVAQKIYTENAQKLLFKVSHTTKHLSKY